MGVPGLPEVIDRHRRDEILVVLGTQRMQLDELVLQEGGLSVRHTSTVLTWWVRASAAEA
jgi:hypothetical protein